MASATCYADCRVEVEEATAEEATVHKGRADLSYSIKKFM